MAKKSASLVRLNGVEVKPGASESAGVQDGAVESSREFDVQLTAEFDMSAARGGTGKQPEVEVPATGVVELEFEDGFRIFTEPETLARDFTGMAGRSIASGTADQAPALVPRFDVPRQLVPLRKRVMDRGVASWILRRFKVFDAAAERGADSLCTSYENTIARKLGVDQLNTLCQLSMADGGRLEPITGELAAQAGPLLLFLHGTASSTRGSFGRLWSAGAADARALLERRYETRIFAFEHRSLTESPIRNALDLVRQLPANAILHVVSHSRGGLVGELLCRAERVSNGGAASAPITTEEIRQYLKRLAERTTKDGELDPDQSQEGRDLKALSDELAKRKFKIERFVRVACPARGTTLASERFDLFLSALANLFDELPGWMGATAGLFADLTRALVAQRANPRTLPGLEAMMPDSALIWLVNHREATVRSDLAVIAGDIEGAGVLGRLGVFLSDIFFGGQHDLVVDTEFMVGGAPRDGETWRFFTQGADVSHFSYFGEGRARGALLNALERASSIPTGFQAIGIEGTSVQSAARGIELPGFSSDRINDRPIRDLSTIEKGRDVVFLLPGILGSHLSIGDRRIWLNYSRLIRGEFGKLERDAENVMPSRIIDDYYGALAVHLADAMQVIEWPYDWRKSLADSAKRLANDVEVALTKIGPDDAIHFVGHSMGGLVVRAMVADHGATWGKVLERDRSRFLMLGTPNRGSWSIVQMLIGRDEVTSQLAFADVRNSHRELLAFIRRFPGVLDLLPHDDSTVYASATWKAWSARDDEYLLGRVIWSPPEQTDLTAARKFADSLDKQWTQWSTQGAKLKGRIGYLAGHAPLTPIGISADGPLAIEGIAAGDGRVPWSAAAQIDNAWLDVYYAPAAHGDLASLTDTFNGISEWLARGVTALLAVTPPEIRGSEARVAMTPAYQGVRDEAALMAAAVGSASRRKRDEDAFTARVRRVSVAHAHLREASHDLMLGHYRGIDALMDAERDLDDQMGGALKQALNLRQFPGDLNRSRLFVRPGSLRAGSVAASSSRSPARAQVDRPPLDHAIVTGLGTPGELTPSMLRETVLNALLSYALRQLELVAASGATQAKGPLRLGLSSTLIGTSTSMVSVEDCVVSIIRAAEDANRRLRESGHSLSFDEIEFVELWQDKAIEAVRALKRAAKSSRLDADIRLPSEVDERDSGLVREAAFEDSKWWSRLRIAHTTRSSGASAGYGELRFTLHTDRARLESRLLGTQRRQIDRFVADAISNRQAPDGIAETLYQLLLPNELKGDALIGRRLVLLVDEQSAAYPWEMLKADGDATIAAPALSGGVVRQLDLENFRERGDLVTKSTAFVVGDPLLNADGHVEDANQLPGARREAQIVRKLLTDHHLRVTSLVKAPGADIIRVLMSERFQILHLAGHGQYRSDGPDGSLVTGMLLGNGWYLTANEIGQMQGIPELVFVNCCYLARTDNVVAGTTLDQPHQFAASLSTQLMKIGVRGVIAAGWAIDDDAAAVFAEAFYASFVGNRETFGEAICKARIRCYAQSPQSNTWAAFQCYGDPQFRLSWPDEDVSGDSTTRTQRDYVSAVEVISHLMNIPVGARKHELARAQQRIQQIEAQIRPAWRGRGDVLAALGDAYRRARLFKEAIGCYENALIASAGNLGLNALERIHDLKALVAIEDYLDNAERMATAADGPGLDEMVQALSWIAKAARSPSRLLSYGWVCKRAVIAAGAFAHGHELLQQIEASSTDALAELDSENQPLRIGSSLWRIRQSALLMNVAVAIHSALPEQREALVQQFAPYRDQFADDGSEWGSLYRVCMDWSLDIANRSHVTEAQIFAARKAVSPIVDRFADSPRLWSIAREHWWFCQLLRQNEPGSLQPTSPSETTQARTDAATVAAEAKPSPVAKDDFSRTIVAPQPDVKNGKSTARPKDATKAIQPKRPKSVGTHGASKQEHDRNHADTKGTLRPLAGARKASIAQRRSR